MNKPFKTEKLKNDNFQMRFKTVVIFDNGLEVQLQMLDSISCLCQHDV